MLVIIVGALEADILRPRVGAGASEKRAERRTAPAADRAPPFHADMPRDLFRVRQRIQFVERPHALARHAAGQHEPVRRRVDVRHVVDPVVRVERERSRDVGFGVGRREPLAAEQPGLHAIVHARHRLEERVDRRVVLQRAAGQHRQPAERQHAPVEQPPRRHLELAAHVEFERLPVERPARTVALGFGFRHDDFLHPRLTGQRPRSIASSERGTSSAIAT